MNNDAFAKLQNETRAALEALLKIAGLSLEDKISKEDKKFINEVAYVLLQIKFMSEVDPDFICFVCKDGIDRGVVALALFLLFTTSLNGKKEEQSFEFMKKVLFTRAYWARKRPIQGERYEVFHEVGNKYLELMSEERNLKDLKALLKTYSPKLSALKIADFYETTF